MNSRPTSRNALTTAVTTAVTVVLTTGLVLGVASAGTARAAAPRPRTAAAACTMAAGAGLPVQDGAGRTEGTVDVLDPLAQVLPDRRFPGAAGAVLCSARDAYASFQVEVTAGPGTSLADVSMSASALTGPGGASLPGTAAGAASAVQLAREDDVTLSRVSDGELDPSAASLDTVTPAASRVARNEATGACTGTCRFPDVLVPDRDAVYGETRDAFKALAVPAGQDKVVWVDVFVPATATAGTYTGSLTVSQSTGRSTTVPVQLTVAPVTLPATSSLGSAFFYEGPGADPKGYQAAAELGLDDRISVVPDGIVGGAGGPQAVLAPLLDGTDPRVRLQDAGGRHAALTDLPMSAMWDSFSTYRGLFTGATTTRPWAYCDEWGYTECAAQYATHAAQAWPGVPLMAIDAAAPMSGQDQAHAWADPETQAVPPALAGSLGAVVDLQQLLQPAEGWLKAVPQYTSDTADRSRYLRAWAAGAKGRQVWSYLSNMSGSSSYDPAVARFQGYASYGIDQIASEQQASGWHAFNDGLDGDLYWSVNQPTSSALDTAAHGLTGDGELFYPYDAALVGGADAVPLESIRLKRIRNGRQDNELLRLATSRGLALPDGRTARSIAAALFPSLSASAVPAAALDAAEQDLLRLFAPAPAAVGAHDLDCNGTPDFLAVQAGTGRLLFYPRTRTDWTPDAPVTVGTGFGTAGSLRYTALLLPGDLTGDGAPDLLGRRSDGSLDLLPGSCTGRFGAATHLGASTTAPLSVGDVDGDGRADLLDRHLDGTLWLLSGTGAGAFRAPVQMGAGWTGLQITGIGDADHDGAPDLLARRADGSTLLYETDGHGGWRTVYGGLPTGLTLPLSSFPSTYGVGDLSGDGNVDVVAVDAAGEMWRYAGTGGATFSTARTRIGGGWTSATLLEMAQ